MINFNDIHIFFHSTYNITFGQNEKHGLKWFIFCVANCNAHVYTWKSRSFTCTTLKQIAVLRKCKIWITIDLLQ